jgi:hypothetical protein
MLKQIDPTSAAQPSRFAHAWRALRHRNFRLFFTGQSISLIGTWMTRVATGWLVSVWSASPARFPPSCWRPSPGFWSIA